MVSGNVSNLLLPADFYVTIPHGYDELQEDLGGRRLKNSLFRQGARHISSLP